MADTSLLVVNADFQEIKNQLDAQKLKNKMMRLRINITLMAFLFYTLLDADGKPQKT